MGASSANLISTKMNLDREVAKDVDQHPMHPVVRLRANVMALEENSERVSEPALAPRVSCRKTISLITTVAKIARPSLKVLAKEMSYKLLTAIV